MNFTPKKMKQFLLISLSVFSFANVVSQVLPNAGFENWSQPSGKTYNNPTGWETTNDLLSQINPTSTTINVTQSTSPFTGSYAIELQTITFNNSSMGGGLDTIAGGASIKTAYNANPTKMEVQYKYTQAGTDSGFIGIIMYNGAAPIGEGSMYITSTNNTYALASINIIYSVGLAADSMYIILGSSALGIPLWFTGSVLHIGGTTPGSTLIVDDIKFPGITPGISKNSIQNDYSVFYNQQNNTIVYNTISGVQNCKLTLFDVTGRELEAFSITEKNQTLSSTNLSNGVYLYTLSSGKPEDDLLQKGKIFINR